MTRTRPTILVWTVLDLFDGGEVGGAAGAETGGEGMQMGSEENASQVQTTSDTLEERRQRYRDTVNSEEFKALYDEDMQRIVRRKDAKLKDALAERDAMAPVIDMLRQRYGVKDGDMDALMAAMDSDTGYWEQAADEAGMTVEQYKEYSRMERELSAAKEQLARQRGEEQADRQLQQWYMEAEALKQLYPHFDLQTESQNGQFLSLLRSGVPVQTAFEVIHMDEIKAGLAQTTAKAAERQITNNIRARGQRPQEAGMGGQAAFTTKTDVSKMSKAEMQDIMNRALRGEHVKL